MYKQRPKNQVNPNQPKSSPRQMPHTTAKPAQVRPKGKGRNEPFPKPSPRQNKKPRRRPRAQPKANISKGSCTSNQATTRSSMAKAYLQAGQPRTSPARTLRRSNCTSRRKSRAQTQPFDPAQAPFGAICR